MSTFTYNDVKTFSDYDGDDRHHHSSKKDS